MRTRNSRPIPSTIRWLPAVAGVLFGIALVTFVAGRAMTSESQEGTIEVRYGNVILTVPQPGTSDLTVAHKPPVTDAQPRWRIHAYVEPPPEERDYDAEDEQWPTLVIDSETGEVFSDTLSPARPDLAEPLLASLRVDTSPPSAGWPYDASAEPGEKQEVGNVEYSSPDQSSGIMVWVAQGLCREGDERCIATSLGFTNTRSTIVLNAADARVFRRSVQDQDSEAFERLVAAVKPLAPKAESGN